MISIRRLLGISRQAARQRFAAQNLASMLPTNLQRAYRDPVADENLETAAAWRWSMEACRLDGGDEAVPWWRAVTLPTLCRTPIPFPSSRPSGRN